MVLQDMESFIPRSDERTLQAQIQELVCYVWDNYLQVSDAAEEMFLMGVGNAYLGVKLLLINRGKELLPSASVAGAWFADRMKQTAN